MELTLRELNRTLLARQLLLQRARLPVVRAVERVGPLQAQYVPSPYVALWSRVDAFSKAQLTRALERGTIVQHGSVRGTLHLTSRADVPAFTSSYVAGQLRRAQRIADLDELRAAFGSEPLTAAEIHGRARAVVPGDDPWPAWFALRGLPWVRVPPAGTWGSPPGGRSVLWPEPLPPVEEATAHAVRRYLRAFGPATRKDVEHFLGLSVAQLKPALARMSHVDAAGAVHYDLPGATIVRGDPPAPPRFLHSFDSAYLAHADKARLCAPEHEALVYRTVNSTMKPFFLVDGFAAGTWAIERARKKSTLVLSPFAPLSRAARRELVDEAERLVRWHDDDAESYAVR
jgi:hypothetical protein